VNGTPVVSNVAYEAFGPVASWSWGNGTLHSRSYDQDGRITGIATNHANGINLAYGYDAASRITSQSDTGSSPNSWGYGYDALDRLGSATGASLTQGWTYDANGNRLGESGTQATTFTVSGTSNRLSSASGFLNRTYAYDAAGNALTYEDVTLTYNNHRNRPASTQKGASRRAYVYDALGQLVRWTGGAVQRGDGSPDVIPHKGLLSLRASFRRFESSPRARASAPVGRRR
jgi:YD repeat-containing protein